MSIISRDISTETARLALEAFALAMLVNSQDRWRVAFEFDGSWSKIFCTATAASPHSAATSSPRLAPWDICVTVTLGRPEAPEYLGSLIRQLKNLLTDNQPGGSDHA